MGPEQRCQERMALPIIFAEFGAALRGTRRRVFISCEALPKRGEVVLGRNRLAVIIASAKPSLEWSLGISIGPGKVDATLQQSSQTTNSVFSPSSLASEFRRVALSLARHGSTRRRDLRRRRCRFRTDRRRRLHARDHSLGLALASLLQRRTA